jgi:tRNA threonylcarbamoyladenosine biosynthesis protein TsaB
VTTIFAFDTATTVTTCALVRDGELLGERLTTAKAVLAAADELVRAAGLAPSGLDALVVGTGPGSFTSIRIGLATARGLSLALGLETAGVSTLHAFAGGTPVIDARRGEVFTTGPALARPDDLDVAGARLVGDGAVRYRDLFEAAGAEVPPDDHADHMPAARRLVPQATGFGPAHAVEPVYLRAPDAVPGR